MNSLACLHKKRKFQAELLRMHLPGRALGLDSSSCTSRKRASSRGIYARQGESEPKPSVDHSHGFSGNANNPFTFPLVDSKTSLLHSKTPAQVEPSTTSASCCSTSPQMDPHNSLAKSATRSYGKSEPISIYEEIDHCQQAHRLHQSDSYENDFPEIGCPAEHGCPECQKDNIDLSRNKEFEDLLYSSEAAHSNFVLLSGRWSVGQDAHRGTNKLTIDKEFEQYFAKLLL